MQKSRTFLDVRSWLWVLGALLVLARGASAQVVGSPPVSYFPTGSGRWSPIDGRVTNRSDRPVEVVYVSTLGGQDSVQFGSQVWVPSKATRRVQFAARSGAVDEKALSVRVSGRLLTVGGSEQQIWEDEGLLQASHTDMTMLEVVDSDDDGTMGFVGRLKRSHAGGGSMVLGNIGRVPLSSVSLRGITHMVWATRDTDIDPVKAAALRQWVVGGGTLMVVETQADPGVMRQIVGDAWAVERVDTMLAAELPGRDSRVKPIELSSSASVDRVLVGDGTETLWAMGNWPLLTRRSVGKGEVMALMVEPKAFWLGSQREDIVLGIVEAAFLRQVRRTEHEGAMREMAGSEIGYKIASRGQVMGVLVAFCVIVTVGGAWLHWRGKPGAGAALSVGAALVAGVMVMGIGIWARGSVPASLASVSVGSVAADARSVALQGEGQVYVPRRLTADLPLREGRLMWPGGAMSRGGLARMLWTGGEGRWTHLDFAAGTPVGMSFSGVTAVSDPPRLEGRVNERGLTLSIRGGGLGELRDVVLRSADGFVAPDASLSLPWDGPGPDQKYRAGGGGTDLARRHQSFYTRYFGEERSDPLSARWVGHAWVNLSSLPAPLDLSGLSPGGDAAYAHDAMLMMPLELARPAPGSKVALPPLLLPMMMEGGAGAMAPYDPLNREWLTGMPTPRDFLLRFRVPAEVMPLRADEVKLELALTAPDRTVELRGTEKGGEPLFRKNSPSGEFTISLTGVQPDRTGIVSVRVSVSDRLTPSESTWHISRACLRMTGVVGVQATSNEQR